MINLAPGLIASLVLALTYPGDITQHLRELWTDSPEAPVIADPALLRLAARIRTELPADARIVSTVPRSFLLPALTGHPQGPIEERSTYGDVRLSPSEFDAMSADLRSLEPEAMRRRQFELMLTEAPGLPGWPVAMRDGRWLLLRVEAQ